MKNFLCSLFLLSSLFSSCATVSSYDTVYLNDPEMQLGNDSGKSFNQYIHSIREGSTPAGTTKSSGGCGCN